VDFILILYFQIHIVDGADVHACGGIRLIIQSIGRELHKITGIIAIWIRYFLLGAECGFHTYISVHVLDLVEVLERYILRLSDLLLMSPILLFLAEKHVMKVAVG